MIVISAKQAKLAAEKRLGELREKIDQERELLLQRAMQPWRLAGVTIRAGRTREAAIRLLEDGGITSPWHLAEWRRREEISRAARVLFEAQSALLMSASEIAIDALDATMVLP